MTGDEHVTDSTSFESTGPGVADAVRGVVKEAVGSMARVGRLSLAGAGDALETPCRGLARRITAGAMAQPKPVGEQPALAAALADSSGGPVLGGATAAALAGRVARRVGPLRFIARRTPMWMLAAVVPALHASVARGADEIGLVASHLVLRARGAGVEPDPDCVRRATVQILSAVPVDTATEPRHTPLVVAWLQRAVRSILPFAGGAATRHPEGLAEAAAAVNLSALSRKAAG